MRIVACAIWIAGAVLGSWTSNAFAQVDYDRDVLPLLRTHCIDCHGHDQPKAQLRLDSLIDALKGGDSGERSIVPGDSSRSHLIARVQSSDESLRMPPDGPRLSTAEIALLKTWIDQRELWEPALKQLESQRSEHWSLQPIKQAPSPGWQQHTVEVRTAIDAHLQARLEQSQLELSPAASRRRLIRRLYLVMLGIPPEPMQVTQFVNDDREDAWERLVDRVLASPRYGERWATHWLDLIRFGETNGFETNRERPTAFRFRDWVIDAFNDDKSYDQFVKSQLAGDALDDALGTGYLVAGPNDIVKGQDALLGLMQRQDELADIVGTTGSTFLGLTVGCARCHNHKFDPITQSDYYAIQAVFAGVQHGERSLSLPPDQQNELNALRTQLARARETLHGLAAENGQREPVNARSNVENFEPRLVRFVRFHIEQTNQGEACIDELQIFSEGENVALATLGTKVSSSGDFQHPLHKLKHINDGQFGNAHSWIASERKNAWVQVELVEPKVVNHIVWGRDQEQKYADRLVTRYRIEGSVDGSSWQLLCSSKDRRPFVGKTSNATPDEYEQLLSSVRDNDRERAQQVVSQLRELAKRQNEIEASARAYVGTFTAPPETKRMFRGDPTQPREIVSPGGVAILGQLDLSNASGDQQRRLAFANWLFASSDSLLARVWVNRLWQHHFGNGLVDTPSDFGAGGTMPSHPQLMEWLASELVIGGWSTKRMHRQVLCSQAWQQDSSPHQRGLDVDAPSRLLWRYPPRRLEAEALRDSIVCTSGQMDWRMHGPGFSAFEVEFENVRHYHPKANYGPEDWRRMIYMTKVRQEKDSTFGVFDCPDASQVAPKRSRSTTPLQALNLMNSRFVNQQADLLSARLHREAQSDHDRIALAFELCYTRPPNAEEEHAAREFIEQFGWKEFSRAMLNTNEFAFIP